MPVTLPHCWGATSEPGQGQPQALQVQQARQRLVDARQFLEAAELLDASDVVATCAIHAAIAAADAITCHAFGERSSDGNHVSAVDLLRQVDVKLSTTLSRALDRKTQAGYESVDISAADAASCVSGPSSWLRRRKRVYRTDRARPAESR